MNIAINTQIFAVTLRLLNQIAPTKATIPILSHVLIAADTGSLRLSATDLELALVTSCPATVVEPGVVALPAKKLLDIVEQLPNGDLQIVTDKAHVRLLSGAFAGRLQTMTPEDFPSLPTVEGETTVLPTEALRITISRVRYAISDKGKYTVNGALLTLTDRVAALVATDGKRLALATMPHAGVNASAMMPTKALDAVMAVFDGANILFSQSERHLFFQAGNRLLISRTLDGQFPSYERIIPRTNDKLMTVDCVGLSAALRRVGLVSEENMACYLDLSEGALDITSSSAQVGDAAERVAVQYTGEPLRVCCNWRFVLDFLEVASGQMVTMALKDTLSPMLLTDGDHHLAVVMLMRI